MSDPLFAVGQVFASPPRIAVLRALLGEAKSVSELTEATGRSEVAVRRHLEKLEALGVAERVPPDSGRTLLYRSLPGRLRELADAVQGLCA